MDGENLNSQKKGTVKYIILGGVIVLLLLVLAAVAAVAGLFGSKKGTVQKAFANTFLESWEAIAASWQLSGYRDLVGLDQNVVGLELNVGRMGSFEIQMAKDEDIYGGYLSVGYLGSTIRVADYYLDSEELRLTVPVLGDSVYYVDRSTLDEDLDKLVEKGYLDEETAEYLKVLNTGSTGAMGYQAGMEAASGKILRLVSGLYDEIEVEKIADSEFQVGGKQRKCKGYNMKAGGSQIADFYLGIRQICEEEPEFAEYMKEVVESGTGISLSGEPGEEDSLDQTLAAVADYFKEEDYHISADIYIYKDTVAHVQIDFDEDASMVWDVYGGSFPLENTEVVFTPKDGGETVPDEAFRLERSGSREEDSYQAEYRIVSDGEETAFGLQYDLINGDFSMEARNDYATVTAEGNIRKAGSGKELVVSLDSVAYDGDEVLSGELTISGEAAEIGKPEGDMVNLLEQLQGFMYFDPDMDGLFTY